MRKIQLICISLLLATSAAVAQTSSTFFRDLAETRNYSLGRPLAPAFTPDNRTVIFLRGGARDPVLRLYAFDIASGQERELISPEQILAGADETLSPEEKARRERARISTRGFTAFELSQDGKRIVVTLSGKLYLLPLDTLEVVALPGSNWIDPRLSPDGNFLAAVKDNDLHVIDLATRAVSQVTTGATETLHHAVAEFVAQEEMSRREGYWWSPDSDWIVYQENDESGVEVRYIADPLHPEFVPQPFFYPRTGTANTKVRLGVIARHGGPTQWIDWERDKYPYLARVIWSEAAAPLTLVVQNRSQQEELVLAADPTSGKTRTLLTEKDPAWINLDDSEMPAWFSDGQQFLWTTERGGTWQVELHRADGTLERVLTPKDFRYSRVLAHDEANGAIYVQGGPDPREAHIWRFPLDGGAGTALTADPGVHSAVFSEDATVYVHSYHRRDGVVGAEIVRDGMPVAQLPSVAEVPPDLPQVELTRVNVGKGTKAARTFDAAIVRPRPFEVGRKYPVILSVYAGPTAKMVTSALRAYFADQWMADQGYVVVRIDGR
ncbi:MAG: DPP IV N-terminal domain-containing protein, partial [Rhodobacteraceae bacterium]|nr:DPP IV N-terminal domain-containing protein [Paracoccaceae bacterium]